MYIIYEKDNLGRTIFEIVFKNTGSVYAKDGVAYFLAHTLSTRGSKDKKEKFYSELEERAITLNVTANKEFITVSMNFLNEKSSYAIKKLIELLQNPNFTQDAFEKTKKEILSKKENLKNNNDYIAATNLFKTMFKNTPLALPVIGEEIEKITPEDIQKHFKNLGKLNAVIINGGKKFSIDEFIEVLPKGTNKKDKFFTPNESGEIKITKEVEQSYIHFGAPFNVEKDEYYLAKIATFILGAGGFGSRMMEEIRVKRGYAYSAYAVNEFKKTYKILKGHLQTKLENTEDAIKIVKELINDFVENGISAEELDSAKKFLIGSEPLRNETLSQRLLRKFNEYYLELGDGYYKKELEKIKNASLDEVNDFIKKHQEIKNLSFSIVTNE